MNVLVKICGVTTASDAAACAAAGADFLGINFWKHSKRCVDPAQAGAIANAARAANPAVEVVGVFVNPSGEELAAAGAAADLDWLQLHGDESREAVAALGARAFKAVQVKSAEDVAAALEFPGKLLLLDAPSAGYGGSGEVFDWNLCDALRESGRRWLLAGGLTPENVARAISVAKPSGVDTASGVEERPGRKDLEKVRTFIDAAKGKA